MKSGVVQTLEVVGGREVASQVHVTSAKRCKHPNSGKECP